MKTLSRRLMTQRHIRAQSCSEQDEASERQSRNERAAEQVVTEVKCCFDSCCKSTALLLIVSGLKVESL